MKFNCKFCNESDLRLYWYKSDKSLGQGPDGDGQGLRSYPQHQVLDPSRPRRRDQTHGLKICPRGYLKGNKTAFK